MTLCIADAFTDSLGRLTGPEHAALNPAAPDLSLHQVERSRAEDFWTARVTRDP